MRAVSKRSVALVACLVVGGSTLSDPAFAGDPFRNGFVGGLIGGFFGQMLSQPRASRGYYYSRPQSYRRPVVSSAPKKPSGGGGAHDPSVEVALASLGSNKNLDNVLREVAFKSTEASAGSDDGRKFGRKGDVNDVKVDLPSALDEFTKRVQGMSSGTTAVGDVSIATVETALNEVYEAAPQELLRQFENLPGAQYTPEQFKVDILHAAEHKLGRFREGNNRGMVLVAQIKQLFELSAHDVFVQTFEIAELTAMNQHVVDFDRALFEKGDALGASPAEDASQPLGMVSKDTDEDQYPGTPATAAASTAKPATANASGAEPVSKMRHITTEMLRLAQVLADDIPFDQTRETRDIVQAYRYRLTRATIDCFTFIAAPGTGGPQIQLASNQNAGVALAPTNTAAESADDRYEDLVRKFQVSISNQETSDGSANSSQGKAFADEDGQCRAAAYRLAGLDGDAAARKTPSSRDLSKLREPEPEVAVWNVSAWEGADATAKQK
jgi:hypothetical protein